MERSLLVFNKYKIVIFFLLFFVFLFFYFIVKSAGFTNAPLVKNDDLYPKKDRSSGFLKESILASSSKKLSYSVEGAAVIRVGALQDFERFSILLEGQLYEEDTAAIDTELLQFMVGEEDLALVLNNQAALEDYILRRIRLASDQDKYHWLILLNNIGLTSPVSQQALLEEIDVMTHVELVREALHLLEPLVGGHGEEVMDFLSRYSEHPNTKISEAAVTMRNRWSASSTLGLF